MSKIKKIFKIISLFFLVLIAFLALLNYFFPLDREIYKNKYSKVFYDQNKIPFRMKISDDYYWRFYVENKDLPPLLIKSILNFEDKYFYLHKGVNFASLVRAFVTNLTNSTKIGGSTITMQLVKLCNPKSRTYLNKIIEILRALQLELYFNKDQILNMYFNKAPYGGNIEGVRAASYFYFNKNIKNLSISQIAILTTIPKNPNKNRPDKQKNLDIKKGIVLKKMLESHLITKEQYARGLKEKINLIKSVRKNDLIQYTNNIRSKAKTNIYTSIDYSLQTFIQDYLKKEVMNYKQYNLNNAACLVIDNKNLNIKAYVASNDFNDKKFGGENDGILMKKSPGSTLKPFVYALAMDNGLISPKKELLDIRMDFNGYLPKNYNKKFYGIISAEEALKLSLNIPVIDIESQLGNNSLFELLEKANIPLDKTKSKYGLSLAVGGMDISLKDLVLLYSSLPNEGILKNKKLFSSESAYLVSEILSNGYKGGENLYLNSLDNKIKIAFKTGTSSKAKHLYTIGYTKEYTIGVWFGNFNGTSTNGDLTGSRVASNAVFKIFDYINKNEKQTWLKKPKEIFYKRICPYYYLTDKCKKEDYIYDFVIKKEKPLKLDPVKINFLLKNNVIKNIDDVIRSPYYDKINLLPPLIVNPHNNEEFIFDKLILPKFRIIKFKCKSFKDNKIMLLLNGKKINNNSFLKLKQGNYELECLEGLDKKSKINFKVRIED